MTDIPAFPTATFETTQRPLASRRIAGRIAVLGGLMRTAMALTFCGAMVIPDHEIAAKVFKFDIIFKNAVQRLAAG